MGVGVARRLWVVEMAFLFAKPETPAEQLRKHKRGIDRAIRDLERERNKLQMQEKKIISEIRKAAAQNQQVRAVVPRAPPAARAVRLVTYLLDARAVRGQDHGQGPGADA